MGLFMPDGATLHPFYDVLELRGDHIALINEDGTRISYADLGRRAESFADQLRKHRYDRKRGLLLIEMVNRADAVVAYLGALRAHWPVILASEGKGDITSSLVADFCPDLIWRSGEGLTAGPGSDLPLHPDLGVMLSTSGSTGSTKLVRLSRQNLQENARSIAEYLELDPTRIAATTLPMHYSYGLSVLNSFLLSGGALALTDASVIDPGFRKLLDQAGVTDLAGVPYTYELFERLGLRDDPPATLEAMTQAGGRLSPEIVARYAEFAQDRDLRFYVMYGQTEATARMAYLPPAQALSHPDCIGVPIPRGTFELRTENGTTIHEPGQPGELIYRGPNVMMGYGLERADLAHGPELSELATGDIAELKPEGLYRIVGRMSRFSKIAGLRIGFDEVEELLRGFGFTGHATGNDETLLLALRGGDAQEAQQKIARACGLPAASIHAWVLDELPVLASGKTDYMTLRETGLEMVASARAAEAQSANGESDIARIYARALNRHIPEDTASFASLGGDSLAYVSVSIQIEEALGMLPDGWENMPVHELQALAGQHAAQGSPSSPDGKPRKERLTIGMDVVLRLLAISLVFIGHGHPGGTEMLRGGANVLFALAGYSMAMIHLSRLLDGKVGQLLKGTIVRLVVPYMLLVTLMLATTEAKVSVSWYLLGSVFVLDPVERGPLFIFWFIETLIHAIVVTCVLFLIPWFRSRMRHRPYEAMIVLVLIAGVLQHVGARVWPNGVNMNLTLDGWLYAFYIGWAAFFARSTPQKLLVIALAALLTIDQVGLTTGRVYWLTLALLIVMSVPALRIAPGAGKLLVQMAGATYFMYLCHPFVIHLFRFELEHYLPVPVVVMLVYLGSIAVGLAASAGWQWFVFEIQNRALPKRVEPGGF